MCLIAFAIDAHPRCRWLLASNRDEVFDRPTLPLHRWPLANGVAVVAGRDQQDGGTWLGVSEGGRVALLTNVRSPASSTGKRSRGTLPLAWLQGEAEWCTLLAAHAPGDYGGFNLVLGDLRSGCWQIWSNRDPQNPHTDSASAHWHTQPLAPGVYSLSNAALDTPWPKAQRLKQVLTDALARSPEQAQALLANALADRYIPADDQLPRTGVPLGLERGLAPTFVSLPERGYGTRSSLIARAEGSDSGALHIRLDEWTHPPVPDRPHRWSSAPPRCETWRLAPDV